jgi:transcriptional regulator with GAF, ATPase, and Fis domain
MASSDISTKLLRLAREAAGLPDLLKAAIDLIADATKADAVAIVRATAPTWTADAARGATVSTMPMELAAEALEREAVVRSDRWFAAPLTTSGRADDSEREPSRALLLRGSCADTVVAEIGRMLTDALTIVTRAGHLQRRADRLETMLAITRQWQQTNDMATLLVEMAEAATEMFDADRASIFLWDKPNKTIVGRPALGVKGGELRLADTVGVVGQVIQSGEPRRVAETDIAAGIDRAVDKQTGYRTKTLLCVPLVSAAGSRLGAFEVLNKRSGPFTEDDEAALLELASYAAVALESTQQFEQLLTRHERLVELAAQDTLLVGDSPAIDALRSVVRRVGNTDLAILILGENGTGKEVVARSLHYGSRRRNEPFIAVNCAALTETLLESELFGHEKGAFTDAHDSRAGKFELASGGTLFLDEIGDMSLAGQAKLLRVLEEKTIVRVGGSSSIHTDVRVLAATNQNLSDLVRAKRFRQDLYFRLNVVSLELPPLRDRGEDIMLLAEHFLRQFCRQMGRRAPKFTANARKRLISHAWPGNVRELRNLMERLAYLTSGDKIEAEELAFILSPADRSPSHIDAGLNLNLATHQFQQSYIRQSIERARGNVSLAAKNLGVHRSNLYRKMRQLGMETDEDETEVGGQISQR